MFRRIGWGVQVPSLTTLVVVGLALAVAVAIGRMTSMSAFGARELVIFALLAGSAVLVLVPSDRILQIGFAGWILTFGFGWRTIHLTSSINLHPAEVLAWMLFGLVIARKTIRRERLDLQIPFAVPLLMVLGLAGLGTALVRGDQLGAAVQESKVLFLLIPCYYIVKWLLVTRADWEISIWLATLVAVYISLLGFVDYVDPALSTLLTGRSAEQTVMVSVQGFERAGFVFFGSAAGAFVVMAFLAFAIHFFLESLTGSRLMQVLTLAILLLELFAVYISGYRGLWIAAVVLVLAYSVVQRRAWILLAGGVLGLPFLPTDFVYRAESLLDLRYADSSQFKRLDRARQGVDLILQSPVNGVGWAGSGYVHSDLVQLAANLGLPALLVFVLWLVRLGWSMFRLASKPGWIGQYAAALLASLCALAVVLTGEGIIVWAQLIAPAWFLLALCHKLTDFASAEETSPAASTPVGSAPAAAVGAVR